MLTNVGVFSVVREAAAAGRQESANDWTPLLCAMGLIIAFAFVTFVWTSAKLRRLMMSRSPWPVEAVSDEVAAGEPGITAQPKLLRADSASRARAAQALRELVVARLEAIYKRIWHQDLLITFGYWLIPNYPMLFGVDLVTDGNVEYLAFMFLVAVSLRRLFASTLFCPSYGFGQNSPWRPRVFIYVDITLITVALYSGVSGWHESGWAAGTGLVLAALFHLGLLWRRPTLFKDLPNLKLTVLRVFDRDEASKLTFDGLLDHWAHYGTFFTVVDSSYFSNPTRGAVKLMTALAAVFLLPLVLALMVPSIDKHQRDFNWFVLLPLVVVLCAAYSYRYAINMHRLFVGSASNLRRRLEQPDAFVRRWSLTYQDMPLMCFDDTWKMTVSAFVDGSDAILMDLRGFSESRKGCEYEVGVILDAVAARRMVFLVDPAGVDQVEQLILARWTLLSPTSPNRGAATRKVRLFVVKKEDDKEIQCILDWVLYAASCRHARRSA